MKKFILFIFALVIIFVVYKEVNADEIIIPDESIRIRVIPNSNSTYDQAMKEVVKSYLEEDVYMMIEDTKEIDEVRDIIDNNIDNINFNIQDIFDDYKYNMNFDVNYGYNYFPKKEFKNVIYEEGYYESLVVSIGEANGDNWWCVLFPNLCVIEEDDVEYTSLVREIVNKIF